MQKKGRHAWRTLFFCKTNDKNSKIFYYSFGEAMKKFFAETRGRASLLAMPDVISVS
jgi:hypothetical protein